MPVAREHMNERRIPGRGQIAAGQPLRGIAATAGPGMAALVRRFSGAATGGAGPATAGSPLAGTALATGAPCWPGRTAGPASPCSSPGGPPITLRIGVYGNPGLPAVRAVRRVRAAAPEREDRPGRRPQAGDWQALQGDLKSGHGLDDFQAIPVADIAAVTSPLAVTSSR